MKTKKQEVNMGQSVGQWQSTGDGFGINAKKCSYHLLLNRNQFYLHHALILVTETNRGVVYRLVVYHNGELLTDLVYTSLRGAKIAFKKFYKNWAYSQEVEAQWHEIKGYLNLLYPLFPQLPSLSITK